MNKPYAGEVEVKTRSLMDCLLLDRYATNRNDLIAEFYAPCLERSEYYDRAVGYFRSSILTLAARPVADFALRGGRIRLICSPELSNSDVVAIEQGYEWRDSVNDALQKTIDNALQDPLGRPIVEFLATLVAVRCLDIRIAFRPGAIGIFHDKLGIFRDGLGCTVTFTGSSNETLAAWDLVGNHESFDVFRSWTSENDRVTQHVEYFERLWNGREPGIRTLEFPEAARDQLLAVSNPEGVDAAIQKVVESRRQFRKQPQLHQLRAIDDWRSRGMRGILEHSTASGKTFIAIIAMREWLEKGRPVLVLVPSALLLAQWLNEIRIELAAINPKILLVSSEHEAWRKPDVIEGFTSSQAAGARITLATLQTACTDSFLRRVQGGDHLFVVVDEVHRAGSLIYSRVFSIQSGPRLGLSATSRRFGDPAGSQRILDYFGGLVDSRFTISDGIAAGRLCRYTYYVHWLSLSDDEIARWRSLTREIARRIARLRKDGNGSGGLPEDIHLLLIKRADILKKAEGKSELALRILQAHFATGQRWLVYCDDQDQLKQVIAQLERAGFPVAEYHSAMLGDRGKTLEYLSEVGGVVVAIKCIDEGVDIPNADHALILASSRNPREFIQRRGRVLRTAPGKVIAEIHDVIVLPPLNEYEPNDLAIVKSEIVRALHFAEGSMNDAVKFKLRQMVRNFGIDPEAVAQAGFEGDDEKADGGG